ncbi:MAG: 16S rRNA (uracil(1498)-N(3))-methyltransferase [Burkholderiales bacterium]|nr:16S rRNA (uracil(1498)-N(3))-methyltransferase [Burkholderiales bacterium]
MKAPSETGRTPRPGARFHVDRTLGVGADVALPPDAAHHAARVLRLSENDLVTVFDDTGGEYLSVIVRIGRGEVVVRTTTFLDIERESPLTTVLVQGVSSGERMDYTIRKAVELGITRVVPVFTERSVVKLTGDRADRRTAHWRALAIAACEQCGRNRVPVVDAPLPFERWLGDLPSPQAGEVRLTLSPAATQRLADLPRPSGPIALLVGPEGGLTSDEAALAQLRGFDSVRFGPRVLRTETAAVAALAALQTLWGDF